MKPTNFLPTRFFYIFLAASLASCGAMQETAYAPDDVYYAAESGYPRIQSTETVDNSTVTETGDDDYYDPQEARTATSRDYYDVTYRDPHYYRYGRFGFNNSAWSMGMGNPIGMSYGGFNNMGSYWVGGSSFYGQDPFMSSSFYHNNPWASPYSNGGWGNNYYGVASPYWMYPGSYGGYANSYLGYYDPSFGYYGYGGYCPNNFFPATASSVHYGHRNSINSVSNGTNIGTPRIGRQGSVNLINGVAQNIERERIRERQQEQIKGGREIPSQVTIRPSNSRNDRANTRNDRNTRLNPPTRTEKPSRSNVNNGSRSNSRGSNSGGGTNRSTKSGGRR